MLSSTYISLSSKLLMGNFNVLSEVDNLLKNPHLCTSTEAKAEMKTSLILLYPVLMRHCSRAVYIGLGQEGRGVLNAEWRGKIMGGCYLRGNERLELPSNNAKVFF